MVRSGGSRIPDDRADETDRNAHDLCDASREKRATMQAP